MRRRKVNRFPDGDFHLNNWCPFLFPAWLYLWTRGTEPLLVDKHGMVVNLDHCAICSSHLCVAQILSNLGLAFQNAGKVLTTMGEMHNVQSKGLLEMLNGSSQTQPLDWRATSAHSGTVREVCADESQVLGWSVRNEKNPRVLLFLSMYLKHMPRSSITRKVCYLLAPQQNLRKKFKTTLKRLISVSSF